MIRCRMTAPKGGGLKFASRDLIHDGAINMLTSAGAGGDKLIGAGACTWFAAAAFAGPAEHRYERTKSIIVSTSDPEMAEYLANSRACNFKATRSATGEAIDLSEWTVSLDFSPFEGIPDDEIVSLGALLASPMAISNRNGSERGKWAYDVREVDVSAAVNTRLSRIAGREVSLKISPDLGYVASRKSHATFCKLKAEGKGGTVVGLSLPLLIEGPVKDVNLAWYAGIGEKTRMGFGALCAA